MQRIVGRFLPYAGLLAALAILASCITVEGTSSGKMKKGLEQSFLFQSADIFYPDGKVPDDPAALPKLSAKSVKQIQETMDTLVQAVLKGHKDLKSQYGGDDVAMRVRLINTGSVAARVDETGELLLDVKVVQALYRAAIVSAFETELHLHRVKNRVDINAPITPAEQAIPIAKLLDIRRKVRETKGRTIVGDVFSGIKDDDMDDGWFAMTDFAQQSDGAQAHYIYELLFLAAHETGHMVLSHHERKIAAEDCDSYRALEDEADAYAAVQMAHQSRHLAPMEMFGEFALPSASNGYKDFFQLAYSFSGFDSVSALGKCAYADPKARLANVDGAFQKIRDGQLETFWKNIKWKETPR